MFLASDSDYTFAPIGHGVGRVDVQHCCTNVTGPAPGSSIGITVVLNATGENVTVGSKLRGTEGRKVRTGDPLGTSRQWLNSNAAVDLSVSRPASTMASISSRSSASDAEMGALGN
jgi:hypothetical protein